MKKKLLVLAMAGVMTASLLTACGGKETTVTTAATETTVAATTAAETTEAETTKADASEATTALDFDKYLGWTAKEYTAANDEEKLNAAIVYSVYTTEALSGETFDDETKALTIEQMRTSPDIKNVVTQLDTTLPTFADKTIKDLADTGVEQINALAAEAVETEAVETETAAN